MLDLLNYSLCWLLLRQVKPIKTTGCLGYIEKLKYFILFIKHFCDNCKLIASPGIYFIKNAGHADQWIGIIFFIHVFGLICFQSTLELVLENRFL